MTATFGVFVAATLVMTDVYVDAYGVPLATAGMLATTFTFTASLCRIAGGGLADRIGARPVLKASLFGVFVFLAPVWLEPPLAVVVALVFVAALGMGLGMAASFKLIPAEFPTTVGAFDVSYNGNDSFGSFGDAYVARLSPGGDTLAYGTFLGGVGDDYASGALARV